MALSINGETKMKRNWKTTLAGVLGGIIIAVGPQVGARLQGDQAAPPITAQNLAVGLALAAIGAFAKDHDISGTGK